MCCGGHVADVHHRKLLHSARLSLDSTAHTVGRIHGRLGCFLQVLPNVWVWQRVFSRVGLVGRSLARQCHSLTHAPAPTCAVRPRHWAFLQPPHQPHRCLHVRLRPLLAPHEGLHHRWHHLDLKFIAQILAPVVHKQAASKVQPACHARAQPEAILFALLVIF